MTDKHTTEYDDIKYAYIVMIILPKSQKMNEQIYFFAFR